MRRVESYQGFCVELSSTSDKLVVMKGADMLGMTAMGHFIKDRSSSRLPHMKYDDFRRPFNPFVHSSPTCYESPLILDPCMTVSAIEATYHIANLTLLEKIVRHADREHARCMLQQFWASLGRQ